MAKNYQTVIVIDHDEEIAEVSTDNRKWINRMLKLEEEGHAEEVEASIEGNREWEAEIGLFRLPFFRTPRKWTKKQKEEARERLAKVREEVAAKRADEADEEEDEAPAPKKKTRKRKAKAKPESAPEPEVEEDEDEPEDDDDEEEEEVVVKKPVRRRKKKK